VAEQKRVLVVEDEQAIRRIMVEALRDEGYAVMEAADGAQALARVDETRPDLIVLDLMMPILDGRGFLRECRTRPTCARVPVVVVSAAHAVAEECFDLGIEHYLRKPFDLLDLLTVVDRMTTQSAA
jgi:CheY-like chemotaxis protein